MTMAMMTMMRNERQYSSAGCSDLDVVVGGACRADCVWRSTRRCRHGTVCTRSVVRGRGARDDAADCCSRRSPSTVHTDTDARRRADLACAWLGRPPAWMAYNATTTSISCRCRVTKSCCRESLTISAKNYSGWAPELGGIVTDRHRAIASTCSSIAWRG